MRKVVFAINSTADGYNGHEDGIADEEVHEFFTRLLREGDVILFGRTTYQLMVPFWPDLVKNPSGNQAMDDFARAFDAIGKVVFSTTLTRVDGSNTRLVRGNLAEEVLALKERPGKDIFVGSLSLASQLSERGLIDEYRFVIHPVVAGHGPRMFETVKLRDRMMLDLVSTKTFRSGTVALHYRTRA